MGKLWHLLFDSEESPIVLRRIPSSGADPGYVKRGGEIHKGVGPGG